MTPTPSILEDYLLSDEQRVAALARGCDVAVTAGAGTGKTRTLVARYLSLLEDGLSLRSVVALTFTRKAAREMRNRIRQDIDDYLKRSDLDATAAGHWQTIYSKLDAARIGTIHTFCAEILRTHPAEAHIDPRFNVLDETQSALQTRQATEAALAQAVSLPEMAPLFALLRERELKDLIIRLLRERLVVEEMKASVAAESIYDHWERQLGTHAQQAIGRFVSSSEVRAALKTLHDHDPLDPSDKLGAQLLQARTALATLPDETVAGQLRNLAILGEINLSGGSLKCWAGGKEDKEVVKGALGNLRDAWQKQLEPLSRGLNDQDAALARAMPALYRLADIAFAAYDQSKAEAAALDFSDLEAGAIELLESRPAVAAYWQTQVQALLVDEFQDTNGRQLRLVRLLCPEPSRLFIVGDAKQSIYRFRQADVAVFNEEKQRIARDGGRLIDLDTSYRTHDRLVTGMNDLLGRIMGEDGPERPAWVAPFAPLCAHRTGVRDGVAPPFLRLQLALGERKADCMKVAAQALAAELALLEKRCDLEFGDMAILCRATGSFAAYEDALDEWGIPYLTVAGKGFYDRPEIRDLLNALRALDDPHDDLALAGLLRSPAMGLSDAALYRLVRGRREGQTLWASLLEGNGATDREAGRLAAAISLISDLNRQAGRTTVARILGQFLDRTQYRAILRQANQPRALRNVSKLLSDVHTSGLVSVGRFLEYAQALRDSGNREGEARATAGGAVQIMTIHAAKGLEFPVVVLGDAGRTARATHPAFMDPEWGLLLPQSGADGQRAMVYELAQAREKEQEAAETDRLLYVAITRAEEMIIVNGHARLASNGLSTDGWLKQLDGVLPFASELLVDYAKDGSARHDFDLTLASTPVRVSFYEPKHQPVIGTVSPSASNGEPVATVDGFPLLTTLLKDHEDRREAPNRVWRVTPGAGPLKAPGWIVGELVHAALAQWRFPDERFADWCAAQCQLYGLVDRRLVQDATGRSAILLRRFRQHALFAEIDAAEQRLHELPFNVVDNGKSGTRYIDLLYRRNGQWTLVDFKTDEIPTPSGLLPVMRHNGYVNQMQSYGKAVEQLAGVRPRLVLLFLDVAGGIALEEL